MDHGNIILSSALHHLLSMVKGRSGYCPIRFQKMMINTSPKASIVNVAMKRMITARFAVVLMKSAPSSETGLLLPWPLSGLRILAPGIKSKNYVAVNPNWSTV